MADDQYFHEKEVLNKDATRFPVYNDAGKQVGTQQLDISLYFDPYESTALSGQIGSLRIETGADEITWGYQVNTNRRSTYGGEVVQILSMYADKMVIKGTCRNYQEQRRIYEYFRNYIRYITGAVGGSTRRKQNFLQFRYPAREWSFVIMVVDASDMIMRTEQAAPEWQITAEIVSENDRLALGQLRKDRWANVLPVVVPKVTPMARSSRMGRSGDIVATPPANLDDVVYSTLELTEGESGAALNNFKMIAQRAENDPYGDMLQYIEGGRGKIPENFAAMMASYATGDYNTFVYNPLNEPERTAEEIYAARFGSEVAFVAGGSGVGGGGTVDYVPGISSNLRGRLKPVQIAALAAAGLKFAGVNPTQDLLVEAVKIAAGESGYNTLGINYNINGNVNNITYEDYKANYANVAPETSSGSEEQSPSFDLGIWQINNYWHPNAIRKACGENVSPSSPPAGSSAWQESVNRNIELGNHMKMLDDPIANANAMGLIYANNGNWGRWVAVGKPGYVSADADARQAVATYLGNPTKYDQEVVIPTGEVPTGNSIALAKQLLRYHKAGKYIDGDGTQISQITMAANGLPVTNDVGMKFFLFEKVLRGLVYLIQQGFTIETYSLLDRPDGYGFKGYHPRGQAVDISGINGRKIGSSDGNDQILQDTIKVATLLNRLSGDMFPDQLITFGAQEGGPTNMTLAGLCVSPEEGRMSAERSLSYYAKSVNGHKDHIHVAWGPQRP